MTSQRRWVWQGFCLFWLVVRSFNRRRQHRRRQRHMRRTIRPSHGSVDGSANCQSTRDGGGRAGNQSINQPCWASSGAWCHCCASGGGTGLGVVGCWLRLSSSCLVLRVVVDGWLQRMGRLWQLWHSNRPTAMPQQSGMVGNGVVVALVVCGCDLLLLVFACQLFVARRQLMA